MKRYFPALLIVFAAAVFLPPYADSFFLDDYKHIEFIRALAEKPWEAYKVAGPFWIGWYYRPVQHWLILASYLVFGVSPFGYYGIVLAIHALNIALLSALARAWRVGFWGILVTASLFAMNAVYQDVLGWISSVSVAAAACFFLLAMLAYMRYLRRDGARSYWLVIVLVCWLLALLAREESIVFVVVLPLLRYLLGEGGRLRRSESMAYVSMLLIVGLYALAQWVRPTWTPRPDRGTIDVWYESILQGKPFKFLAQSAQSLFVPGLAVADDSLGQVLLGVLLAAALILWIWRGGRTVRFGLLLALALLGSTYLLIWSPFGGAVPGRYLYLPWIGITLAIGATVSRALQRSSPTARTLALAGLLGFILLQLPPIDREHRRLYGITRVVQDIRQQMLSLAPDPAKQAHFFAYNFFPVTDYVQSMAVVWYDRPFRPPGGHLGRLRALGYATDAFVVLNYEDQRLYNLMPELAEAQRSQFVWSHDAEAQLLGHDGSTSPLDEGAYSTGDVVGPAQARRYGLYLHPPPPEEGWASLAYEVPVPEEESALRFAIFRESGTVPGEDGMTFRVRALAPDGRALVLFEETLDVMVRQQENPWREVEVELDELAGRTVVLRLEVFAEDNLLHDHGYWANPRIVLQ